MLKRVSREWIRDEFGPYMDRHGRYLEFETDEGIWCPVMVPGVRDARFTQCIGYELRAKDGPVRRQVSDKKVHYKMYLGPQEMARLKQRQPELFNNKLNFNNQYWAKKK